MLFPCTCIQDNRSNTAADVLIDEEQNVYVAGSFIKTVDFDPGPGIQNLVSTGEWDAYLACLNNQGELVSIKTIRGPASEMSGALLKNGDGSIYWIGTHNPGANLDPCYGINMNNAGQYDFFIAKFDRPLIEISASTNSICFGSSVEFSAVVQNPGAGLQFQWQLNGTNVGTNSSSYSSSTLNNDDRVNVIVFRSASCGTVISDTSNSIIMNVGQVVTPQVSISSASSQVCTGETVNFTAIPQNGGSNPNYQWTINGNLAGTNNEVFTTNSLQHGDIIQVQLTSSELCVTTPSVFSNQLTMQVVTAIAPAVTISTASSALCPNQVANFSAQVQNTGNNSVTYQWKVNGQNAGSNTSNFLMVQPENGDQISCVISTNSMCSSTPVQVASNEITMMIHTLPLISITPANSQVTAGQSVQLTAQITGNFSHYLWQPPSGLSDINLLNPVATPTESAIYTLRVFTTENCSAHISSIVNVVNDLYIPNSFTPNNDGINDVFRIPPNADIEVTNFNIYDRYGRLVFHSQHSYQGWDGNYKGQPMPSGNYIYLIIGSGSKGEIYRKGNILLLR